MVQKKDSKKTPKLPNNGYVYPMACGSCLKLWVDDKEGSEGDERVFLFGHLVFVRDCPRCIFEADVGVPGIVRP